MTAAVTGRRCQCPTCGDVFSTEANFARHLIRDRDDRNCIVKIRCKSPSLVGLVRDKHGAWAQPSREGGYSA